jgi:hypothetical protein
VLVLALLCAPAAALACAACACGNPVLTSMGTEPPLANRVRLATTVRAWTLTEGVTGMGSNTLRELRLDLLASWAPTARFSMTLALPVQAREVIWDTLARERAFGTGDLDATARLVLFMEDKMRPRWVVAATAGMRFPTAPLIRDASGVRLSDDAQLGGGGFAALAGLTYGGFFGERFSLHGALLAEFPFTGREGTVMPIAVSLYASPQFQPADWVALRVGGEARAEAPRLRHGEVDDSSSGFAFFLAPEVLLKPASPLTLLLGARIPLGTTQREGGPGLAFLGSVVVDL